MKDLYFDISGGLFLILDGKHDLKELLNYVRAALIGGVDILGLENADFFEGNEFGIVDRLNKEARKFDVPLIVVDHWEMLNKAKFDGVHISQLAADDQRHSNLTERDYLLGVQCFAEKDIDFTNEIEADYVSLNSSSLDNKQIQKLSNQSERIIFLDAICSPVDLEGYSEISFDGIIIRQKDLDEGNIIRSVENYKAALNTLFSHN